LEHTWTFDRVGWSIARSFNFKLCTLQRTFSKWKLRGVCLTLFSSTIYAFETSAQSQDYLLIVIVSFVRQCILSCSDKFTQFTAFVS